MALSLVGTDVRRTQDTKGFHRRDDRAVQDRGACLESSRGHAANDQRRRCTPRAGSFLWPPRPFSPGSETGTGSRTDHPQYSSLLPKHDSPTHPTQVGRRLPRRCSARIGTGLASQARPLTQVQGPHSVPDVPPFRQSDALGIAERGTKPDGLGRSEGHQQAQATSSHPPGKGCLANTRRSGSAFSDHRADWPVLRFANQRNTRFAVDGLRFQAIGGSDPTISGRKAAQQIEDGVLAGRGPDRTGLHPRTEEMASALCRIRGAMAVPESGDRSALSCRFVPTTWFRQVSSWDLAGSGSTHSATPTVLGWTKPEHRWAFSRNSCDTRTSPPQWTSMGMPRPWQNAKPIGQSCNAC